MVCEIFENEVILCDRFRKYLQYEERKELLSIGMCINGHLTKKKKYVECHNFLKIKNNKLLNVEYL